MSQVNKSDIKYITNSFLEVFDIKDRVFGKITLGYFNAFKSIEFMSLKDQKVVKKSLNNLFNGSSVVAGDLNSTPFKINEYLENNGFKGIILSKPSYLFPKKYLRREVGLPSFDNFIILDKKITKYSTKTLIDLPEKIRINPRKYMKQINSPSDHVPVVGIFNKNNKTIKIGIYNVADPVFWGKFYENAKEGFDVSQKGERKRQVILLILVERVIKMSDISFFTEVPESFIEKLDVLTKKYNRGIITKDTLSNGKKLSGISKNVLIY